MQSKAGQASPGSRGLGSRALGLSNAREDQRQHGLPLSLFSDTRCSPADDGRINRCIQSGCLQPVAVIGISGECNYLNYSTAGCTLLADTVSSSCLHDRADGQTKKIPGCLHLGLQTSFTTCSHSLLRKDRAEQQDQPSFRPATRRHQRYMLQHLGRVRAAQAIKSVAHCDYQRGKAMMVITDS